ncbi:MAG: sodium ion-translocating decarboxylase subunit beta, partial [Melioribacteraceae bacterium]
MGNFLEFTVNGFDQFMRYTAFANFTIGHLIMLSIALIFLYLAIAKEYEPMLLVPIGFGILVGNIPFLESANLQIGIYENGSVLNYLYFGVLKGIYPPIIFLGIGAMTDFSTLLSNPKLVLLGAAAQLGIFGAYTIALFLGYLPQQAASIGI